MAFLTTDRLELPALTASLADPRRGAQASFVGTVRDHHGGKHVVALAYSAYGPMAERVCDTIVAEAQARWPVSVAMRHRTGPVPIGEAAVMIVAAGDHRDEAFAACRYIIEETKRRVPIWKRERYADGTEAWVDPTATSAPEPAEPVGRQGA